MVDFPEKQVDSLFLEPLCTQPVSFKEWHSLIIELDDGKIYRKALYLMVKTHGFPVDFPLNQSNDLKVLSDL